MAIPEGVVADGNILALWVPAIADTTAPTVTELTAAGVVDLSCYLTRDGLGLGGDEATVVDDRLCSRQTFEAPGTYTDTLDLTYVYDPQAVGGADNEAYETLKRLAQGHVVLRYGKAFEDAPAAGDVVDILPGTAGIQRKQPPEANAKLKVTQKIHIRDTVQRDVAVVTA